MCRQSKNYSWVSNLKYVNKQRVSAAELMFASQISLQRRQWENWEMTLKDKYEY
jgi:hypothetical protein